MLPDKAVVLTLKFWCCVSIRRGRELLGNSGCTCKGAVLNFATERLAACLETTAKWFQAGLQLAVRLLHACDYWLKPERMTAALGQQVLA